MDLGNDKRQKTPTDRGCSSTGPGEAQETGGREIALFPAAHEHESPADTADAVRFKLSRTAVYGPVRTVVWQGSVCTTAAPMPILFQEGTKGFRAFNIFCFMHT